MARNNKDYIDIYEMELLWKTYFSNPKYVFKNKKLFLICEIT